MIIGISTDAIAVNGLSNVMFVVFIYKSASTSIDVIVKLPIDLFISYKSLYDELNE